jgi:hypothetical protein
MLLRIFEAYAIAIVLLVHCSLLLCTDDSCFFNIRKHVDISASLTYYTRSCFNILPISLSSIQKLAHFFLLGDCILLILLIVHSIQFAFKKIIFILILATIAGATIYLIGINMDLLVFLINSMF